MKICVHKIVYHQNVKPSKALSENVDTSLKLGEFFAKYIYDRDLTFTMYNETSKLNSKKTNNPIFKGANSLNRQFTKGDKRISKKHREQVEESLTSLIIR